LALGVDLIAPTAAHRLLVFGTRPEAAGHCAALRSVRPRGSVGVDGRVPEKTAVFVDRLRADGVDAEVATAADVVAADVVAWCTTAREPLFDGRRLPDTAVVVACGSHERGAREVDTETVRRCVVVVESVTAACGDGGDVVLAMAEGAATAADLVPLGRLVWGEAAARPRLIKTVGMGWEDLAVATAVLAAVDR
jgi:ornithine cyclodeaminase